MFGEHAPFIIPAYLISFFALAVTAGIIMLQYRRRKTELQALETNTSEAGMEQ